MPRLERDVRSMVKSPRQARHEYTLPLLPTALLVGQPTTRGGSVSSPAQEKRTAYFTVALLTLQ